MLTHLSLASSTKPSVTHSPGRINTRSPACNFCKLQEVRDMCAYVDLSQLLEKCTMKNMTSFGLKAKEVWSAEAVAQGRCWDSSQ